MKNIKLNKNKMDYTRTLESIENIKNNLDLGDYGDFFLDYDNGYICDIVSEIADNNICIYNNDIWNWARGNDSYIEEAMQEFGVPQDSRGLPDLMRIFQQGQFYAIEQDLYEHLQNNIYNSILNYIKNELKVDYITSHQKALLEEIDFDDNNQLLEDLEEQVKDIVYSEKLLYVKA